MYTAPHGGRCCGIKTIHEFPTFNTNNWEKFKRKASMVRVALEVVLTTRKQGWHDALKGHGFQESFRFVNPNTGNTCVVYHRPPLTE